MIKCPLMIRKFYVTSFKNCHSFLSQNQQSIQLDLSNNFILSVKANVGSSSTQAYTIGSHVLDVEGRDAHDHRIFTSPLCTRPGPDRTYRGFGPYPPACACTHKTDHSQVILYLAASNMLQEAREESSSFTKLDKDSSWLPS